YFNYAQGFSIGIPTALPGRRGQEAGPERGVSIPLASDCTSVMVVFGEPNSLEWTRPSGAVKWEIGVAKEDDSQAVARRFITRLGKLKAAGVTIRHQTTDELETIVVAFRPGGSLFYQARLSTTEKRYSHDLKIFMKVLQGFRLEALR
ncbi:MAG TPA: hypothetical protein VIC84_02005, partial [Blastocatellia bacterium]